MDGKISLEAAIVAFADNGPSSDLRTCGCLAMNLPAISTSARTATHLRIDIKDISFSN